MSKIHNNSLPSTLPPGISIEATERTPITYFGDSKHVPVIDSSNNTRVIKVYVNNTEVATILDQNDVQTTPQKYDYILYAETDTTHLYVVMSVGTIISKGYLCYKASCDEIDKWSTTSSYTPTTQTSIDINITYRDYPINVKRLLEGRTVSFISGYPNYYSVNTRDEISRDFKEFIITPNDGGKIGYYRIILDFIPPIYQDSSVQHGTIITNASPAFDSMIPQMFNERTVHLVDSRRTSINDPQYDYVPTYEDRTCRGYLYNYNRKSNSANNFDDERLDEFSMIIKDFNDGLVNGVWQSSYTSTVYLPGQVFSKVKGINKYQVKAYIYTDNNDGTYSKNFIGDVSDILN